MVELTKDNVMQARYTNPEQDTISILFIDFDSEGKARANYEIFCQAGDQQHKELHAAGWDHAKLDAATLDHIIGSQRTVGEKTLGHEATKIIDARLQVTKDALAAEMEATVHAKKILDDMRNNIENMKQEIETLKKQKDEFDASMTQKIIDEKVAQVAHLRKTNGTSVLIANFLFDNNTDEVAIEILKNATGKTGNTLIEILTQCTKEGGGNTKY